VASPAVFALLLKDASEQDYSELARVHLRQFGEEVGS
jgi:hypothetical protein